MTDIFRVRIERDLIRKANKVAQDIGTTPGGIVRMLFTQLVRRKSIPFELRAGQGSEDDLLDKKRRNRILSQLDDSEGW